MEFFLFREDLLGFSPFIDRLPLKNSNIFIVVQGKKGEGKTYFLKLISKKLNVNISNILDLKRKKSNIYIIDDFHHILYLQPKEILEILNKLKNENLIISVNPEYLQEKDKVTKLIKDFLSSNDISIDLKHFYKEETIKNIVDMFFKYLNEKGFHFKQDNKDFLFYFLKRRKLPILFIKKLLNNLYLKIMSSESKELDLKKYFSPSIVSSFYWEKEIKESSIDISTYSNKIKDLIKKDETMDLNLIMNKFLEEDNKSLKEIIKEFPDIIEKDLFVSDYNENMVFNGIKLRDLIKNITKPQLVGYKDNSLYLIYVYENLENINVKDLTLIPKLKSENIKIVLATKRGDKNKNLINKYNLNQIFDRVYEIEDF